MGKVFVGAAKFKLGGALLCDIGVATENTDYLPGLVAYALHPRQKPAEFAIFVPQGEGVFPVQARLHMFREFLDHAFGVLGMVHLMPPGALHFCQRRASVAEPVLVEPGDLPVGAGFGDPGQLGNIVGQVAQALLGFKEFLLPLLSIGDIGVNANPFLNRAGRVNYR